MVSMAIMFEIVIMSIMAQNCHHCYNYSIFFNMAIMSHTQIEATLTVVWFYYMLYTYKVGGTKKTTLLAVMIYNIKSTIVDHNTVFLCINFINPYSFLYI